jgi:competence protein ComFC
MGLLTSFWRSLINFLFPKPDSIQDLEHLFAGELLRHLEEAGDTKDPRVIAIFNYADSLVRELVWELKYRGSRVIAEKVAKIIWDVLQVELSERALTENFGRGKNKEERPILMPMPISDKRRNERGYNQTEILCEEIKKLDTQDTLKYIPRQLMKHKHTEPQTLTATKKERLENVVDTMHVIYAPAVSGRDIILIDDVTTTGATFKEAKRALHAAGAKKILCLAIAH